MSDLRRLLVITYYFGSDGSVGGLRWAGITKYLARLGWEVSVITAAPPGANGTSGDPYVEWCPRLWTFLDGCRLLRRLALGRSPASLPNNGSRVAPGAELSGLLRHLRREVVALLAFPDESRGWVLRAALRARSVIRRFQPHVVVSSGPPHSAHLVAGIATIGSAARWLIDLRDPWAGPYTKAWDADPRVGSRTYRALSRPLERLAFGTARRVITNTHQFAEVLAAKYPTVSVACIPNGVDPECLPPPASSRYPGLGVAYTGTLYGSRDLGPVVRALQFFLSRHPEAARAGSKLRIAGPAELRHARAFSDAVAAAGMQQYVELLGPLPRGQALEVVRRSRLAVVLAQEQELQIPAKLYESIAMGVPTLVVAPAGSAAGVEGTRVGASVRDSDDIEGIAGVLEQLWGDGSGRRSPCAVPITYEAIAPAVDKLLRNSFALDAAGYRRYRRAW
ncbi:MAG TPA: glycosyltransferase [Gemmatimonadales bacterium]|nr:glycosyltransferase [Gemmatimonadales bacterium]